MTNDVHSAVGPLINTLASNRLSPVGTLFFDSGDFYEGDPLYLVTQGAYETSFLDRFYASVAPGNHGFAHYRDLKHVTSANVHNTGNESIRRSRRFRSNSGPSVTVTAVMSESAFNSIPPGERLQAHASDPISALRLVAARVPTSDLLLVLSHGGWDEDVELASRWRGRPLVIASGHCHSKNYGPTWINGNVVVKGPEIGRGAFIGEYTARSGWAFHVITHQEPSSNLALSAWRDEYRRFQALYSTSLRSGRKIVGALHPRWNSNVSTKTLAEEVVAHLAAANPHSHIAINNNTFRSHTPIGGSVVVDDLMRIEPFSNELVKIDCTPNDLKILRETESAVGPIVIRTAETPDNTLIATQYLCDIALGSNSNRYMRQMGALRAPVARLLTKERLY